MVLSAHKQKHSLHQFDFSKKEANNGQIILERVASFAETP
jgi:hypothetical protein